MVKGWYGHSMTHSLASRGIITTDKQDFKTNKFIKIGNQNCMMYYKAFKESYLSACVGDPSIPFEEHLDDTINWLNNIANNKYGKTYKAYRVLWTKGNVNIKNLGLHYSINPLEFANIEALFKIASTKVKNLHIEDDAKFFEVNIPIKNIDYCKTLEQQMDYPFEEELSLKSDKDIEIIEITNWQGDILTNEVIKDG